MLSALSLAPISFGNGLAPMMPSQPAVARVEPIMFGGKSGAKPKKAAKKVAKVAKVAKKAPPKPVAKPKPKPVAKRSSRGGFGLGDLQALALEQNTALGYWDPLKLAEKDFWEQGNEATIGFLRHAEIKHGRVAMAAFVGYCFQANGIIFPWAISGGPLSTGETVMFSDIAAAGSPPEQWDAVPTAAKLQILIFIFLLEWVGESGPEHYMRGGKPGYYPSLKEAQAVPHPVPYDLYDPFGLFEEMDEETKARRLNMEVNNGRLAMIGIFSFLSASKGLIVPGLEGVIQPYDGEYMGFFSASDASLPFVETMMKFSLTPGA